MKSNTIAYLLCGFYLIVFIIIHIHSNVYSEYVLFCSAYSCNGHEFRCGDGLCVKKQHLCDGIKHCTDGSDELHCNDNNIDVGIDNKIIGKNISSKCMHISTHIHTKHNQRKISIINSFFTIAE